jgi:hypothetical protein
MRRSLTLLAAVALFAAGCGSDESTVALPQGDDPVELDPADFTTEIDNPFFPMVPGSRWVYREKDVDGTLNRVVVTVTDRTKTIMGIEARVVHDVVTEDDVLKEDTFDWYAQDKAGNLWYLGEDTKEYEDGKVASTEGSWEAGVDGALAGVLLPADPEVGTAYRQEYYEGEAEDRAEVESVDESVEISYGSFEGVLKTKETTPLEPGLVEHKYYAKGVGVVLVLAAAKEGPGREELVSFKKG